MSYYAELGPWATGLANVLTPAAVLLVATRLAVLDTRARGRNAFWWGAAVLFLGPLGWIPFGFTAIGDWRAGRRGLLRGARAPQLALAALAGAVLLAGTLLGATRVQVPAGYVEPGGYLAGGQCGRPADFLARESRWGPREVEALPDTPDERELFRIREACTWASAQRLVVAWGLLALAGLLTAWVAGEQRARTARAPAGVGLRA